MKLSDQVRILVELKCEECNGSGVIYITSKKALDAYKEKTCPACKGKGCRPYTLSLVELKNLLEGGGL